jgi:hypothetical protein
MLRATIAISSLAVALASVAVLAVSPAWGLVPLQFESKPFEVTVYSTRVHFVVSLQTEAKQVKWCSFYAESPNVPDPKGPSSGCETSEEENGGLFPVQIDTFLGTAPQRSSTRAIQHHLQPGTTYNVLFVAENSSKKTESEFSAAFTTEPVLAPEISPPNGDTPEDNRLFWMAAKSPRTGMLQAEIDSNGSDTKYDFEYAPAEAGHAPAEGSPSWESFAKGTVTKEEDYSNREASVTGLLPETRYCMRVIAVNLQDERTVERNGGSPGSGPNSGEEGCFTTPTEKPLIGGVAVRNVTGSSAGLQATVNPHRLATPWRLEYISATSYESEPCRKERLQCSWTAGPEGVVTLAQAEALPEFTSAVVVGTISGLKPSTTYYARLFAENSAGEGEVCFREAGGHERCESALEETLFITSFKTFGPPVASTLPVHGLHGEALRVMGGVSPETVPTSAEQLITLEGAPTGGTFTLTFADETTQPIAFDAPAEGPGGVGTALNALAALHGGISVTGANGGPYKVYFSGVDGEKAEPPITVASALTPAGQVKVVVLVEGGEAYDVNYHFDYVSQKQFEESEEAKEDGFVQAAHTLDESAGVGQAVRYVGADLPAGLIARETYLFRIVATSTAPGNPVVTGAQQSLTVPAPPTVTAPPASASCPNKAVRTGLSAGLPNCRAYEQLTPVDKGGAKEIFNYGGGSGIEGATLDESGDHLGDHLEFGSTLVAWGSGARDGQSPYFFSRGRAGWGMTAAAAQPEAGVSRYTPKLFAPDYSEVAFEARWQTSPAGESPDVEFKKGSVGGPYATLAAVRAGESGVGWVASSSDFSKLVLQTGDHELCGASTGTGEGEDLYEYSEGECRQVNVTGTEDRTIGGCGARIAAGFLPTDVVGFFSGTAATAATHAVSGDGSHVFFEAVPGRGCAEPQHTYVRVAGGGEDAHTVDLGAYRFVAADQDGGRVLLEKPNGEGAGLYIYTSESGRPELLPGSEVGAPGVTPTRVELLASQDLSAVYILRKAGPVLGDIDIYRYDIVGEKLVFVTHIEADGAHRHFEVSSDGQYLYFIAAGVAGMPAGGLELKTEGAAQQGQTSQAFRYDSAQAVVQCLSCASGYDPQPLLSALFTREQQAGGRTASDNGNYVFFDTPAALLSGDVDGQIAPEGGRANGGVHTSDNYSVSSDVYEWRRGGVDGCGLLQGCLALITSGNGGFLNILLGTDRSGKNVFFATNESLVPDDNDTAGDIYDARVNGGFEHPAHLLPCEGDACASPPAAPNDATPGSLLFHGAGNFPPKPKPKPKLHAKKQCGKHSKHGCKRAHKRSAQRSKRAHKRAGGKVRRTARHAGSSGRTGR